MRRVIETLTKKAGDYGKTLDKETMYRLARNTGYAVGGSLTAYWVYKEIQDAVSPPVDLLLEKTLETQKEVRELGASSQKEFQEVKGQLAEVNIKLERREKEVAELLAQVKGNMLKEKKDNG